MKLPYLQSDTFVIVNPIDDEWLDRHQWFCWHTRVDDIQAELGTLYYNNFNCLDKKTVDLFRVDREARSFGSPNCEQTVEDHFRSIKSAILEHVPNIQYLGMIEIATEAGNLLKELEAMFRALLKRAKQVDEFLKRKPEGWMWHYDSAVDRLCYENDDGKIVAWMMGTRMEAEKVEEVRNRLCLHRKYLEGMLRGTD